MGDSPPPCGALLGYLPCPATDLVSSLAVPEGSDYLDGEDVYHHWLPPLVQSLADRLRGSQAGETSASVSRVQPMQAIS